ncbi:hypothetical protein DSM14862_02750 [Sulfitobacter indolifex]|uniref:Secreted protein n=1 Tax=Sulfitobacter indolifex HEL-45 TaxID=391624 RepID=A0ABM9X874_9RHOB|nr:hypothetical protein OIHEL45_03110 [Sulfitobacter indolifex HEL-45]UOA19936.1 hypothetical protein DSM14862_02750 [Sulfitobacter indolifex]
MMKYAAAIIIFLSYTPLSAEQLDMDFLIEEDGWEDGSGNLLSEVVETSADR